MEKNSSMNADISIVVPVYNVEKYLQRCINSILSQEYMNYEIILVDDGSTDKSGRICDEFLNERIKVIHKSNGGLSSARNAGMEIATGKYIMFLDSDDFIEKDCLLAFGTLIETYHSDIIVGRSCAIYADGKKEERHPSIVMGEYTCEEYLQKLTEEHCYVACSPYSLYNSCFIKKNDFKFYEGIVHEDELWTPIILLSAETIYYSDVLFYNHCIREGSITQSEKMYRRGKSLMTVCNELLKYSSLFSNKNANVLRDQWVFLYLESICFMSIDQKYQGKIKRILPIRLAYYKRTRIKALIFFISPSLYIRIWKKMYLKGKRLNVTQ